MAKAKRRNAARKRRHRVWQVQEAKARFSELVDEVIHDGYQTISRSGKPVAVLLSTEEFEKLKTDKGTLVDFFMNAPFPEYDLDLERDKDTGREVDL
jgi:prevent-host-death family protein